MSNLAVLVHKLKASRRHIRRIQFFGMITEHDGLHSPYTEWANTGCTGELINRLTEKGRSQLLPTWVAIGVLQLLVLIMLLVLPVLTRSSIIGWAFASSLPWSWSHKRLRLVTTTVPGKCRTLTALG